MINFGIINYFIKKFNWLTPFVSIIFILLFFQLVRPLYLGKVANATVSRAQPSTYIAVVDQVTAARYNLPLFSNYRFECNSQQQFLGCLYKCFHVPGAAVSPDISFNCFASLYTQAVVHSSTAKGRIVTVAQNIEKDPAFNLYFSLTTIMWVVFVYVLTLKIQEIFAVFVSSLKFGPKKPN